MPGVTHPEFETAFCQLKHQAVRDLAWCCFSSPMMSELPGSNCRILAFANEQHWPWLFALDKAPLALLTHLAQRKSTRLGIYYEALWHFYFNNHPEWELLHHNLQIDRSGITLGAFDFLCRHGEEYWHIETALKFYLCRHHNPLGAHDWKYWIGPSGEDRLDLKLNHLRDHQLPLHQTDEGLQQLNKRYPEVKSWNAGLCLQGYLFSPAHSRAQPAFSHDHHGRGYWWHLGKLPSELLKQGELLWLILDRELWLAPALANRSKLADQTELIEKLNTEIKANKRPVLVASMRPIQNYCKGDNERYWIEASRFFVVPNNWPDQSTRPGIATPARNT